MKETNSVSDWKFQNLFRYMIYCVNSAAIVVVNIAILLRYVKNLEGSSTNQSSFIGCQGTYSPTKAQEFT